MSGYLIDTDWIIDVGHGQAEATRTLAATAPAGVAVSLISYGELYEGVHYARNRDVPLDEFRRFLEGRALLPLSTAIMETFAVVRGGLSRQLRQQIGDLDLLIAATALTHDSGLLTRNLRDFEHIPDLKIVRAT